jgi:hypothetical protein
MNQAQTTMFLVKKVPEIEFIYDIDEQKWNEVCKGKTYMDMENVYDGKNSFIIHLLHDDEHYYSVCQNAGLDFERWGYYSARLSTDSAEMNQRRTDKFLKLFTND